jgi:hypothetical protein
VLPPREWPDDVLKHFLQMINQFAHFNVVVGFPSWVLDPTVLPPRMYLLLQWNNLMGQPIGHHADSGQVESLQLTDSAG